MSANDSLIKALRDGGPIGNAFLSAFGAKSDEQKKAEADQAAALANAQDQLQFDKGVYGTNQQTADDAMAQIFGQPRSSAWDSVASGQPAAATSGAAPASGGAGYDPRLDPNSGQYDYQYALKNYAGGGQQTGAAPQTTSAGVPTASAFSGNPNPPQAFGLTNAPAQQTPGQPFSKYTPTGNFFGGQDGSGAQTASQLGWNSQLRPADAPWSLPGEYDKAAQQQQNVFDQLRSSLNGIQDPQLAQKVADIQSQANLSPEALAARSDALGQLKGYTNVQETAQERLMRDVARREMENQMKGQREAMAANLKSRGVYGSGAEIASQLQTQQEAASRRAQEELAAQANAQTRAMQALGQYGTLGIQAGNQDLAQGQAHDMVNEFNNTITEQHNMADAKQKAANNTAAAGRATTVADAGNNLATGTERRAGNLTNTIMAGAGLKTGVATQGANLVNAADSNLRSAYGQDAAQQQAKDNTGTGYSPISL